MLDAFFKHTLIAACLAQYALHLEPFRAIWFVHTETDGIAHRSDPSARESAWTVGFEAGAELGFDFVLGSVDELVVGAVAGAVDGVEVVGAVEVGVPPAAPSDVASADVSSAIASSVRFA
jgi:hypothetical protein